MSLATPTGPARSRSASVLLILCLLAAAVAAAASLIVSIQNLHPTVVRAANTVEVYFADDNVSKNVHLYTAPAVTAPGNSAVAIAAGIIAVVLFALVAVLVWRLLTHRPFARALSISLIAAGCAI